MQIADALYVLVYVLPLLWARPIHRLVALYGVMFMMSLVLTSARFALRRTFPTQTAFARPCEGDGTCLTSNYAGGMPSGHMAVTTYSFASLCALYPSPVTMALLVASAAVMAESRYRRRFHTVAQIAAGAALGVLTAVETQNWTLF
jgi:membrane-associated phospholipid phosphatase